MVEPIVQDLLGLSRDVACAVSVLGRWRSLLATDPESQADTDPFEDLRHVAAKSTWERLGELDVSAADAPLRLGLRRWVLALVQARLAVRDDLAWAQEAALPNGRFEGERPRGVSWREAWRGLAAARSPAETRLWLDAAAGAASTLVPIARLRASRRVEVARRLGLAHPWEAVVPIAPATLRASAASMLDRTEDLSRAVWRESLGSDVAGSAVLNAVVAREAGEGWPARLTARWLEETFRPGAAGLPLELPPLPSTYGAASFARALSMFGFAVRRATAQTSLPFAIAHEPGSVGAYRLAHTFGALAADPEFYVRALGLGRRASLVQARVLARTALFEVRLSAARILLGDDVPPGRDAFDEIGSRLFGAPVDRRLHGAWPAARENEPARWVALLEAPALRRSLRERFDSDWFLNPRAWSDLRSQGAMPAYEPVEGDSLAPRADALARAFEDALG